jgi:hypothetical protein
MFTFEFLKFGKLALRSAPHGAFEVLHIVSAGRGESATKGSRADEGVGATAQHNLQSLSTSRVLKGRAVARVEIEKDDSPFLRVSRLEPQERSIPSRSFAHVDSVTLTSWRDDLPTDFELNATGTEDGLDLVLSGHRHYHLFWWRVQFEIVNEEVIIHGPFLADNPSS